MGYAYAFQFFQFGEGAAILYVLTHRLPDPRLGLSEAALAAGAPPARRAARRRRRPARIALHIQGATRRSCRCRAGRWRSGAALLSGEAAARRSAASALAVAALLIFLWSFGPFLWLVIMSLSPSADLVRTPPSADPAQPDLRQLPLRAVPDRRRGRPDRACRRPGCRSSILNSLIVAVCGDRDQPRARLARRLCLLPATRQQPAPRPARSGR